jgi:hypothetical protein
MRHDLTLAGITNALKAPTRVNIVPGVQAFGGQSLPKLAALARACEKISGAVRGGAAFAQVMTSTDLAVLKSFVDSIASEFALADAGFRSVEKADEQHSRDGYSHPLDLEKL